MAVDKEQQEELMTLYNELKFCGVTSVSSQELERFAQLFTLSLPRCEHSLVREDKL